MSSEDGSASNIERLRELTNLDPAALDALYSDASRDWLEAFAEAELPKETLPAIDSSRDFVEIVHELSRSKRAWSQRLGVLVIELSDSRADAQESDVGARLAEFAQACPWKFLSESARRKL
jgi:hypothetical protein